MTTLENIQAKIAKLQAQAEAIAKKQSSKVIAEIRDLMASHGVTIADIEAHAGGKPGREPAGDRSTTKTVAAKYRDPKSGATWTGRGRAPAWIASAKDRNKFLIDGTAEQPAATAKTVGKVGNYVRGPQAPKYRDPKSGATWSGRGRAPAWLADAKDRTAFLIDGAGEGEAETKVAAAKKGAGKKVATKKVASKKAASKKVAAKKATAKKSVATTAATKKAAAKKGAVAVKKSPAKKAATKKTAAKKAAVKELAEAPGQAAVSAGVAPSELGAA
ncbi:H-NS family nucleoid-associated regulatory protein [Paraburkholderia phenoliruptrix]|uniref:H-NS family nucleoid-associated regulatory protein n=1 Tax=Paraburkholderia phenoliruptrix TaxID=252970 RepID=UPI002869D74A|nr:H-NS family nucleoid-associated regulatory protein [Paraburkholderia phenoliruptrix]WMY10962.1 H-NS family nucleoid-associated regulatory protein [Paraburkholderia phenoliruptrix]